MDVEATLAQRLGDPFELIVVVDARQRPQGERAIALDIGTPIGRQRVGDASDVTPQRFRVTEQQPAWLRIVEPQPNFFTQRFDAFAMARIGGHARYAEELGYRARIGWIVLHLVNHVESDDERDAQLRELQDEVKIADQLARVDDRDHEIRSRVPGEAENGVQRDLLFGRARRKRIRTGHVCDFDDAIIELERAVASFDRDARIVADARILARQPIEKRRFTDVRIADDDHQWLRS